MKKIKLENIVDIYNGSTPSTTDVENFGGEIPWVTPKDLANQQKKYISRGEKNITKKGLASIGNLLLPTGTILLTSRAPIGLIALSSNPISTNQGFKNIVCDSEKIHNEYLFYKLQTLIPFLQNSGTGTTFKELSKSTLEKISFSIHTSTKTQQEIAKVLYDLDAKIALNNRINEVLEAKAKLLYDYWFVQFEFPTPAGSSSGIEGKPYKSSGGKMVYNKKLKREIPEGWEVKNVGSFVYKTKTGSWGKENIEGNYTERIFCVRGADINGLNGIGEMNIPERYILPRHLDRSLEAHDFIIEISGGSPTQSTGRVALITEESFARFDAPLLCTNFCRAITLKDNSFSFNFYREWQRAYDNGVLFQFEGKTSGIKNFLFDLFLEAYEIATPPQDLVEKFYSFSTQIEKKKQTLLKQNQHLASLRDWLLPMLMNGQVGVERAYEIVDGEMGMVAEPGES